MKIILFIIYLIFPFSFIAPDPNAAGEVEKKLMSMQDFQTKCFDDIKKTITAPKEESSRMVRNLVKQDDTFTKRNFKFELPDRTVFLSSNLKKPYLLITGRFSIKGFFRFEKYLQILVALDNLLEENEQCINLGKEMLSEVAAVVSLEDFDSYIFDDFNEYFSEKTPSLQLMRLFTLPEDPKLIKNERRLGDKFKRESLSYSILADSQFIVGELNSVKENAMTIELEFRIYNKESFKIILPSNAEYDGTQKPMIRKVFKEIEALNLKLPFQFESLEKSILKMIQDANCDSQKARTHKQYPSFIAFEWNASPESLEPKESTSNASPKCIFNTLFIYLSHIQIEGFPTIQVYFSANTNFKEPIKLDYMLDLNTEPEIKEKIGKLWSKFTTIFKENETKRLIEIKRVQDFEISMLKYKKAVEDGFRKTPKPVFREIGQIPITECRKNLVKLIMRTFMNSKFKKQVDVKNMVKTKSTVGFDIRAGKIIILGVKIINSVPCRVKVTFYPANLNRESDCGHHEMEFSMDVRLGQTKQFEQQLAEFINKEKQFLLKELV